MTYITHKEAAILVGYHGTNLTAHLKSEKFKAVVQESIGELYHKRYPKELLVAVLEQDKRDEDARDQAEMLIFFIKENYRKTNFSKLNLYIFQKNSPIKQQFSAKKAYIFLDYMKQNHAQICDEYVDEYEVFDHWIWSDYSPLQHETKELPFGVDSSNKKPPILINTKGNFIGVFQESKKYVARVSGKKRKRIGVFKTAEEAARARDAYVIAHNVRTLLNFPIIEGVLFQNNH